MDFPLLAGDYHVLEERVPVLRLFQQVYSIQEPAVGDSRAADGVGWRSRGVGSADRHEKSPQEGLEYSVDINRSPSRRFESMILTNTGLESKQIRG